MSGKSVRKVDRVSQILLYVVMFFLLTFLGTGIYFVIKGFVNPLMDTRSAGFVGIGIFFFGTGLIVLLQTSMMTNPNDSFISTFFLSENMSASAISTKPVKTNSKMASVLMQLNGKVSFSIIPAGIASVILREDGIYVELLKPTPIHISFDSITSVVRDKTHAEITCSYDYMKKTYEGTVKIDADNALRLKALCDEIMKRVA